MHPVEFWWQAEARRPTRMYGSLSEEDVAEIYDGMKERGMFDGAEG